MVFGLSLLIEALAFKYTKHKYPKLHFRYINFVHFRVVHYRAIVGLGYYNLDTLIRLFLFKTKVCLICLFWSSRKTLIKMKKKILHLNGIKMYIPNEFFLL